MSKVKADVVDMDAGAGEDKSVEDDVDLEEMDQLSLFYAEQEDNGDDPDFKPNKNAAGQRNSKRPVAKPVPPNLAIKCQFCHSVFTSSLLLKNHLNEINPSNPSVCNNKRLTKILGRGIHSIWENNLLTSIFYYPH